MTLRTMLYVALLSCPTSQDVPYAHRQVRFFTGDDGRRLMSDAPSIAISHRPQNFRPSHRRSSSTLFVDTALSNSNAVEDNMEDDEILLNDATITSSSLLLSPQLYHSPTLMSVDSAISALSTRSVLEPGEVL